MAIAVNQCRMCASPSASTVPAILRTDRQLTELLTTGGSDGFRVADNPRIERQIQDSRVVEDKTYLGPGKPLSMTSEVMESNFPFSDTADIENDG